MEGFFAEIQLSPLVINSERDWEYTFEITEKSKIINKFFINSSKKCIYTEISYQIGYLFCIFEISNSNEYLQ